MKISYRIVLSIMLTVSFMLPSSKIFADNVDVKKARNVAAYFMASQFGNKAITAENLEQVYELPNVEKGISTMYVFNTADKRGFVVVSGTDCIDPIIAYSTDGIFDPDNIPPAMQWWLRGISNEIAYAQNNNLKASAESLEEWDILESRKLPYFGQNSKEITRLLETKWNQNYPYNNLCPRVTNGTWSDIHGRAYVGCVATAMSQIIRYWKYPRVGAGTHGYHVSDADSGLDTNLYVNYGAAYYDYENMPEKIVSTSPSEQLAAVGLLGFHCGVSVDMGYTGEGSGASSTAVDDALVNYFKYNADSIKYLARSSVPYNNPNAATQPNRRDTAWVNKLVNEILMNRPVYYAGNSPDGGRDSRHAFVCDGWNTSTKNMHFNWGWGGSGDCWCNVYTTQLTPTGNPGDGVRYNFYQDHRVIIGITPPKDSINIGNQSIMETENPFVASVYPNPATSQITVSYSIQGDTPATMQIFDAAGRIVSEVQVSPVSTQVTIPVKDYHPGIYFCRLNGYTQKFVVR